MTIVWRGRGRERLRDLVYGMLGERSRFSFSREKDCDGCVHPSPLFLEVFVHVLACINTRLDKDWRLNDI